MVALMTVAGYAALFAAPEERSMGVIQRIFYFHLPAAWNTFLGFFVVAGASAAYLWQGDRFSYLLAGVPKSSRLHVREGAIHPLRNVRR